MSKIKIDVSEMRLIKNKFDSDLVELEDLIDLIYDLIGENIRLKEELEDNEVL